MNRKGFATIVLIALVVVLAGVVGYFAFVKKSELITQQPTPTPSPTLTPTTPKTGDIEEIQTLLNKKTWVGVIVTLKGNEFTAPEFRDDVRRYAEVKKIQDAVLVTLTKDDFQISHQYQSITSFAGMVSKSGMEKLLNNSQVTSISIDKPERPAGPN